MKNVSLFTIFTIALLVLLLCACDRRENCLKIKVSPSDKTLIDLSTQVYDEQQLREISEFNGTINMLNSEYPVECLRKKGSIYRISYLGNESVAVLLFDGSGMCVSGNTYRIKLLRSDFDSLTAGDSLKDVMGVDPDGEYLFLYSGRNDVPRISSHYTHDGYLISIEYDKSNRLVRMIKEPI